ncbi:MAG TPA: type 1 glutamine amidotransferase [Candidatus Omnitrophota bacterium]|nr:type 1 glutamine amidotransferase [Candidatus Omnitrophota bacterium]
MILILKQVEAEGPGTIGDFLENKGVPHKIVDLWKGDRPPETADGISAVVALGGPMNVYEENKYPYLKDEDRFIKMLIEEEVPYLGICLGAQLLAKAAGARVYATPQKEIGWSKVSLTAVGRGDRLFSGVPAELEVFQWHGDTFDIPASGERIAGGDAVVNQALKVGQKAYGLQFHLEVDEKVISGWFDDPREHLEHHKKIKKEYSRVAEKIFDNFFSLV